VFRLQHSALGPLVDVGRVFGLSAGCGLSGSTSERLRVAKSMLPEHQPIFRDAIETLRVVLYQQARLGIRSQTNGDELPPALLSRHDRQVLKACFRSILRLLEFTAGRQWLPQEPR
jgi:signal-transduction protein with cAMP-binding, CBS, and nucleotidyltransferase domain